MCNIFAFLTMLSRFIDLCKANSYEHQHASQFTPSLKVMFLSTRKMKKNPLNIVCVTP